MTAAVERCPDCGRPPGYGDGQCVTAASPGEDLRSECATLTITRLQSELAAARDAHGLTAGLTAKLIKERDEWKARAIELQGEPAMMACSMMQMQEELAAAVKVVEAAERMRALCPPLTYSAIHPTNDFDSALADFERLRGKL